MRPPRRDGATRQTQHKHESRRAAVDTQINHYQITPPSQIRHPPTLTPDHHPARGPGSRGGQTSALPRTPCTAVLQDLRKRGHPHGGQTRVPSPTTGDRAFRATLAARAPPLLRVRHAIAASGPGNAPAPTGEGTTTPPSLPVVARVATGHSRSGPPSRRNGKDAIDATTSRLRRTWLARTLRLSSLR